MEQVMQFEHFQKLQARYWLPGHLLDPTVLFRDVSKKIAAIENRNFGVDEDSYLVTTKAKIIINGLSLKIYEFIKNTIVFIEEKQYIAAISVLRLCIEHIVMMSYFEGKLTNHIEKKDLVRLQILLFSFCMGERVFYVEAEGKCSEKKLFSTRAEHVNSALRFFDRKYKKHAPGIQILYDQFSNHTHVSPTSAVRMLYRQKVWNKSEPNVNFKNVKLSTKSNSMEKFASVGLELVLDRLKHVETDVVNKEKEISKRLENIGKTIVLIEKVNPEYFQEVSQTIALHDEAVKEYYEPLERKYGKPEQ